MHEQINPLPHTDAKKPLREEMRFTKGTGLAGPSMLARASAIGPDVPESQQSKAAPREGRSRFVNQTGRTFSYDWDISTDVMVQSPESVDILGFSGDVTSTTGKDFSIAVHPDDLEQLNADIRHLGAANPICQTSLRVFRTDGNIVCLERIGRGFFDQQGRLTRLIGIALEVEEPSLASLRAEAAVRESESRYRRIVETTNEGVWLLDSGLCNSFVNQQMAEMLGYEPEEMVGRSVFDFYFPEDVEQKKQILKRRKEGLREQIEERVRRRDGSELWVRMAVIPMFKDDGEFDGALAMVSDITERKRAEESLRLFRALIDESNDAIEVIDPETMCFLDANRKACRELGYSRDEFLSLRVSDIDPTLDESSHSKLQKEIGESGCALFERVHRRKDGSTFPVEINLKRVQLDRLYWVSVVRDITERKRVEETLRQKRTDLAEAQRLARIGNWQWYPETDTVIWSDELCRIAGRDPNEPAVSYRQHSELFTLESWERLRQVVDEALQTGTPYELDLEMILPDGTKKWVTGRGESQRDTSGRVVGLRGTVQDITERKLAEESLASVSKKLIQAQEQERTRIARDLHDDIGQRLSLLAFEFQQLQEDSVILPEVRSRMAELEKQILEIAGDIQSLSHELHSAKLQYSGLAAATRAFCKEFGEQQKVEIDFASHDLPNSLSPDISLCLFRVLQEALHNSVKHSGVKRIEGELREDSGEIHLVVGDSGRGFDLETALQGRGLGLTSMQERVRLVNGTIEIQSKPMGGTTVHVRVPFG